MIHKLPFQSQEFDVHISKYIQTHTHTWLQQAVFLCNSRHIMENISVNGWLSILLSLHTHVHTHAPCGSLQLQFPHRLLGFNGGEAGGGEDEGCGPPSIPTHGRLWLGRSLRQVWGPREQRAAPRRKSLENEAFCRGLFTSCTLHHTHTSGLVCIQPLRCVYVTQPFSVDILIPVKHPHMLLKHNWVPLRSLYNACHFTV